MSYSITYTSAARRQIRKLPGDARRAVEMAVCDVARDPYRARGVAKMADGSGYRLRVGRYRVIYTADHRRLVVTVVRAADRREVY